MGVFKVFLIISIVGLVLTDPIFFFRFLPAFLVGQKLFFLFDFL